MFVLLQRSNGLTLEIMTTANTETQNLKMLFNAAQNDIKDMFETRESFKSHVLDRTYIYCVEPETMRFMKSLMQRNGELSLFDAFITLKDMSYTEYLAVTKTKTEARKAQIELINYYLDYISGTSRRCFRSAPSFERLSCSWIKRVPQRTKDVVQEIIPLVCGSYSRSDVYEAAIKGETLNPRKLF